MGTRAVRRRSGVGHELRDHRRRTKGRGGRARPGDDVPVLARPLDLDGAATGVSSKQ